MYDYYLAHSLDIRNKVRYYQEKIEKELNLCLFNPFYDSDRNDIEDIDNGDISRWELSYEQCEDIVKEDKENLRKCEGYLGIIEEPSIGTVLEMGYAYSLGKEVVVISDLYVNHPWVKIYADRKYKNVEEFIDDYNEW